MVSVASLSWQVVFDPHTKSALVPSLSRARIIAPSAGGRSGELKAILTTSPASKLVMLPANVTTRASSEMGAPAAVGGVLIRTMPLNVPGRDPPTGLVA